MEVREWSASALLSSILWWNRNSSLSVHPLMSGSHILLTWASVSKALLKLETCSLMLVPNGRKGLTSCLKTGLQSSLVIQDLKMRDVPVECKKVKDISFKRNESGGLILPPMAEYRKVHQKQRAVRAYAWAVYSKLMHPILLAHVLGDIQWLKKMSQCLHDLERSAWCDLLT